MMKTIILAGGLGTRLGEETHVRPKPMVEIGGIPILTHILAIYHSYGFQDFVIACGYKGECIKDYFSQFQVRNTDWCINIRSGSQTVIREELPNWSVAPIDTGASTMTGGRLLRLRPFVEGETFMATYGDGVANVDIDALVQFHRAHGRLATVTAVHPPARFGCLDLDGQSVRKFAEKPQASEGWINGGFFVFEPGIFDYLDGDDCVLEKAPLERLCQDGELMAYCHDGFWQPMDTLRDKQMLEGMWNAKNAPWKVWSDEDDFFGGLSRQESSDHRPLGVQRPLVRKVA